MLSEVEVEVVVRVAEEEGRQEELMAEGGYNTRLDRSVCRNEHNTWDMSSLRNNSALDKSRHNAIRTFQDRVDRRGVEHFSLALDAPQLEHRKNPIFRLYRN